MERNRKLHSMGKGQKEIDFKGVLLLGKYEELIIKSNINVTETDKLPPKIDGWYQNGEIFIRKSLLSVEKHEILNEEIAHSNFTYGNILDQSNFNNRKFEMYARRAAFEEVIPLRGIVSAFNYGVRNWYELAGFFEVTEKYIKDAISHYKRKYGLSTFNGDYLIQFEPLRVFEYKKVNKGD